MVSCYVAHVFSELLWNSPSRPYYYWYHLCFYIPRALYFYFKVFIIIIIIVIIITRIIVIIRVLAQLPYDQVQRQYRTTNKQQAKTHKKYRVIEKDGRDLKPL